MVKYLDFVPFGTPILRRIFTFDDEEVIAEIIKRLFQFKVSITNELVRNIMIATHEDWPKLYQNKPFSTSNHYLTNFKEQHIFSIRKEHYKRRQLAFNEDIKQ